MSAKHTPAPWIATPESNGAEWGVDAGRWGICICADAPGTGTAEANARLIAAAPELLDALFALHEATVVLDVTNAESELILAAEAALARARSAIAKATGEQ